MLKRSIRIVAVLAIALCSAAARAGDTWPQFRGPSGLGYTDEPDLPVTWDGASGKNVAWKVDLPGQGHASPIVWGDRVFTSTVHWDEAVKNRAKVMPEHHLTCYSAGDGRVLWDTQIKPGPWLRSDFRSGAGGGYAAPTPVTDGKLIICAFGSAVMAALDFDGHVVWRRELLPYTFDVTVGSSPVLYNDSVILLCAMARKQDSQLIAFDKASGQVKWRTMMPTTGFGHSTPIIIDVKGQKQLLTLASGGGVTADGLQSFDPATGQRLWWCRSAGDAASPAYGAGIVYGDSGRGGPGAAVDPTGRGDVGATHVKWTVPHVPEAIGSPVVVADAVYRLQSPGVLKVFSAATGEQRDALRLVGLTSTWASPLADPSGRLFFASGGKSVVIQTKPELSILATNDLADANHASAAAAGGRIFIMGMNRLYCIAKQAP